MLYKKVLVILLFIVNFVPVIASSATASSEPVVTKYIGEIYEETNNIGTAFIFLGGQRIAAINTNNAAPIFYHPDHLGSTNLMTDNNGGVIEKLEYDPYGKIIRHDTVSSNDRLAKQQFTGKNWTRRQAYTILGLDTTIHYSQSL